MGLTAALPPGRARFRTGGLAGLRVCRGPVSLLQPTRSAAPQLGVADTSPAWQMHVPQGTQVKWAAVIA